MRSYWKIFLASALALYTEIVVIRWLGSEIRMFAYLKNFTLLAAFLGLGFGMMQKEIRFKDWHIPLLACFCLLLIFSPHLHLTRLFFPDSSIYQWGGSLSTPKAAELIRQMNLFGGMFSSFSDGFLLFLLQIAALSLFIFLFAFLLFIFIPFGHLIGKELAQVSYPLTGYTWNLLGSLVGTVGFTLLTQWHAGPFFWILPVFILLPLFSRQKKRDWFIGGLLLLLTGIYTFTHYDVYWSPYYRIHLYENQHDNHLLFVDHDGFQDVRDFSSKAVADNSNRREGARYYNFPYLDQEKIDSVLILGAGTGNDVAAALRANVKNIDAVEIDPLIQQLGKKLHPEHPYASPNVHVDINDARAFLNRAAREGKQYDRIILGLVDSHAALSSVSSLRLEFYLYSEESLKQALHLLDPDRGLLIVGFGVSWKDWIAARLYKTLEAAQGRPPLVLKVSDYVGSMTFVAGPGLKDLQEKLAHHPGIQNITAQYANYPIRTVRDDWPFLYFHPKKFPWVYLGSFLFILLSGIFLLSGHSFTRPSSSKTTRKINWPMFLMGTGFLLLETRNIAQLSLLFGGTWVVNSIVFTAIFIMALGANTLIASGLKPKIEILFIFLAMTLLGNYFFPFQNLLGTDTGTRLIAGGFLTGAPIFFSSLIFGRMFETIKNPEQALASNILGGLLGGFLETTCMFLGIKALVLLALIIYAFAYRTWRYESA